MLLHQLCSVCQGLDQSFAAIDLEPKVVDDVAQVIAEDLDVVLALCSWPGIGDSAQTEIEIRERSHDVNVGGKHRHCFAQPLFPHQEVLNVSCRVELVMRAFARSANDSQFGLQINSQISTALSN